MPLTAGSRLGPYRIVALIGEGGMGEVYRARDPRLDRDVALKILPRAFSRDPDRRARFQREARAAAALNHPHIVTIHSVEESDGIDFITMELVDGQPLDRLIGDLGLHVDRILSTGAALADALAAAHAKGIVHRDLKPANVMVTTDGRVKVLDFGLAQDRRPADPADATVTVAGRTEAGVVMGTPAYMSPEQLLGRPLDQRTDLFSLGVLLYQAVSGRRPFNGPTPIELASAILRDTPPPLQEDRSDLPAGLVRLIQRCLEKDPHRRIQTAREVGDELREIARPAMPPAEGPSAATPLICLPPLLTRLFGRESDIDRLQELFAGRLTTLTGPGGAGKTRLAIEAARRNPTRGRVLFVPLADLAAPTAVPQAIRAALRTPEAPGSPVETQLADALAALPTLMLLDNVEHLISEEAADAEGSLPALVLDLLNRVPTLRIVATSRQPLGLAGEQEFPVVPLPVPEAPPPEPGDTADAERLLQFASVQLFMDRARLKQPDFQATPQSIHAIAALCQRLDGIPLALELAAGLTRVMPPAHMLARLNETQVDLVSRQRYLSDRHRSLSATIGWSYRLLPGPVQSFFCRLSVFRGWWTADAAREVCDRMNALELLALLQDRSLVQCELRGGGVRYRLLETIRQYAAERLDERGEASDAHTRHTAYFASRAAANRMEYRMPEFGPHERDALHAIEDDYPNVTLALDRLLASDDTGAAVKMAATLSRFWLMSRRLREGDERVQALLPLARASDEVESLCNLLNHAGLLAWFRGDYDRMVANTAELLHVARHHGLRHYEATARHGLGVVAGLAGRADERDADLTAAIAILREIRDKSHLAWSLMTLGWLLQVQGLDARAAASFKESLAVHDSDDGGLQSGWCQMYLAMIACRAGETGEADALARRALAVFHREESATGELWMLLHMATIASAAGEFERSAVLAGHVKRLLLASGIQLPPAEAAEFEQTSAQVDVSLGEDVARAERLRGAALTPESAIAYALRDVHSSFSARRRNSSGTDRPPPVADP